MPKPQKGDIVRAIEDEEPYCQQGDEGVVVQTGDGNPRHSRVDFTNNPNQANGSEHAGCWWIQNRYLELVQ